MALPRAAIYSTYIMEVIRAILVDIVLLRSLYTPALGLTGQSDHSDRGAETISLYPILPKN